MGLTGSHLAFSAAELRRQREYVRLNSCFCVTILMSQGYDLPSVALKKPMTSLFQPRSTQPPHPPFNLAYKGNLSIEFPSVSLRVVIFSSFPIWLYSLCNECSARHFPEKYLQIIFFFKLKPSKKDKLRLEIV